MADHPGWLDVGQKVTVVRGSGALRVDIHEGTVVRQTATLVILDTGEKFKSTPWSWATYVLTPPYLRYRTVLERFPEKED